MTENSQNQPSKPANAESRQTPNSDILGLPHSGGDVQDGVVPLTPEQQVTQLSDFIEDNYPEIFRSLTIDEGKEFTGAGQPVPAELKESTERMWAKIPDLLAHSSLLVLGAGLDHAMPHVAFLRTGPSAEGLELADLSEGVRATVLRPSTPNGAFAFSFHGGPGWFGDGLSHDQFWLPMFAALAERSGVTVVDLCYPLPGAGAWEGTQAAVAQAVRVIREHLGADAKSATEPGSARSYGLITFGTGFVAARDVAGDASFHLLLTPRIPEGFDADLGGSQNYVSLASLDSRGTSAAEITAWLEARGVDYSLQEYPAEHIIAAPAVWRQRVEEAAQWLAGQRG